MEPRFFVKFQVMTGPSTKQSVEINPLAVAYVMNVNVPSELKAPKGEDLTKTITGICMIGGQILPTDMPKDKVEEVLRDSLRDFFTR
jgi:hypothetical protein